MASFPLAEWNSRAPSFSITPWAVEIIKEVGYEYDSSLMPASVSLNKRYGNLQKLERLVETRRLIETEKPPNPTNATNPNNPIPLRRWFKPASDKPLYHFVGGVD